MVFLSLNSPPNQLIYHNTHFFKNISHHTNFVKLFLTILSFYKTQSKIGWIVETTRPSLSRITFFLKKNTGAHIIFIISFDIRPSLGSIPRLNFKKKQSKTALVQSSTTTIQSLTYLRANFCFLKSIDSLYVCVLLILFRFLLIFSYISLCFLLNLTKAFSSSEIEFSYFLFNLYFFSFIVMAGQQKIINPGLVDKNLLYIQEQHIS